MESEEKKKMEERKKQNIKIRVPPQFCRSLIQINVAQIKIRAEKKSKNQHNKNDRG